MLTGKELGAAIRSAMQTKGVKAVELARHFGVRPPSVQGWLSSGTISKSRLPELWLYFQDVAGPEHWGMAAWPQGPAPGAVFEMPTEDEQRLLDDFRLLPDREQERLADEIRNRASELRQYLDKQLQKYQKNTPVTAPTVDHAQKPSPNDDASSSAVTRNSIKTLVGRDDGSQKDQRGARPKGGRSP